MLPPPRGSDAVGSLKILQHPLQCFKMTTLVISQHLISRTEVGKNPSEARYQLIKSFHAFSMSCTALSCTPTGTQQTARWALSCSKDVLISIGKAPRTCLEEINPTRAAKVIPCKTFEILLSSMSTLQALGLVETEMPISNKISGEALDRPRYDDERNYETTKPTRCATAIGWMVVGWTVFSTSTQPTFTEVDRCEARRIMFSHPKMGYT